MKWAALSLGVLLVLTACGGETQDEQGVPAEDSGEEITEVPVEDGGEDVAEPVVLYPEGTVDPETVSPDVVIPAVDLYREFFAWDGMEVTLAGYPHIWYGDSAVVENELSLVSSPESTDEIVSAGTGQDSGRVVYRGEIIALRGTAAADWTGPWLEDAVFVDPPEELLPVETSPHAYAGEPIPADQFAELYNTWLGREVVVSGHYHSTTTSTTDYGVTVRVDLADPDDTYTKLIGCEMAGEIPEEVNEAMVANRSGVQIRGTVSGSSFGMVELEDCVIVNR